MEFQICSTINIFNIFSLAKLTLWVRNFAPKFFYVNTCFDPPYFNIQINKKTMANEKKTVYQGCFRLCQDTYHSQLWANGFRSGVRKTLIGQPPWPVRICTAFM